MLPAVALVGRPNVGKSTLFNKLTRSRDALVADVPGLTRDRRYGRCELSAEPGVEHVTLIDTGGLFGDHELADVLTEQTQLALNEADLVVLVLDGREGLTPADQDVLQMLRRQNFDFLPVINKVDGVAEDAVVAEFATAGFDMPLMISASHSRGLGQLRETIAARLVASGRVGDAAPVADLPGVRVAVVGRPNVGKSTLVNRLLGEARQVVFDMPGTTRDAIDIPFQRDGIDYVLIDTAGVRRKGRVEAVAEKFSVVKALEAMDRAHVVVLVLDAREGVVDQDLHVLHYALEAGAGIVVAINKVDGLGDDDRARLERSLERRLDFVPWAPLQRISALHGTGVGHLIRLIDQVYGAGEFDVSTSLLTRLVRNLVASHPAPSVRGRQIKIKMATRAGSHPPAVAVHGNQLSALPASYTRYLENGIREALDLVGNPVKVELREADNPFAGRRNPLTGRQQARRGRLIKHRKVSRKKGR